MRRINEPLARMSNAEDCCKGHFWESRFKSQALLDEAAALTCMAYVDLNPIRAGITTRLEESDHTSIKNRVQRLTDNEMTNTMRSVAGDVRSRTMVIPLKDYITLVEWTGKSIQATGKASIPPNLASIFTRLNINQDNWLGQVQYFGSPRCRAIGCLQEVQQHIEKLGQKWFQGIKKIQPLYLSSE